MQETYEPTYSLSRTRRLVVRLVIGLTTAKHLAVNAPAEGKISTDRFQHGLTKELLGEGIQTHQRCLNYESKQIVGA